MCHSRETLQRTDVTIHCAYVDEEIGVNNNHIIIKFIIIIEHFLSHNTLERKSAVNTKENK